MRALDGISQLSSNRPLAALVSVSAVSGLGDWMYLTALPILIYQRTGDAALVGLMGAARMLPAVVLSMPAGWLADRVSPRSILLTSETIRCLAMAIVAGLSFVAGDIWLILVVATAAAAAGTFYLPASMVLMPRLARDDEEFGRANSAFAGLDGIANILGPAIAGILVVAGGLPLAFVLNGLTFAVMVVVVAAVVPRTRGRSDGCRRRPDRRRQRPWTARHCHADRPTIGHRRRHQLRRDGHERLGGHHRGRGAREWRGLRECTQRRSRHRRARRRAIHRRRGEPA